VHDHRIHEQTKIQKMSILQASLLQLYLHHLQCRTVINWTIQSLDKESDGRQFMIHTDD